MEYTTFCTLILVGFTGFLREHFSIERNYEPLIWFCLLIPCTYIVTYHNRSLWNIFVAGMVFCGLQIIVFCIMGMYFFDAKQITVGWPEDPHHPKHEIDWKFGLGVGGILQALHNTSWYIFLT